MLKQIAAFLILIIFYIIGHSQFSQFSFFKNNMDVQLDAINWTDFNNVSSTKIIAGINRQILLQVTVAHVVGTPAVKYGLNNQAQVTVVPGSPQTFNVVRGSTLQFFIAGSELDQATITVRNITNSNTLVDTVTATVKSSFFFVLSSSSNTGDFGGLSGADLFCLNNLKANDWMGKNQIVLHSANVKSFLCDSSRCNQLVASKTYNFALSGTPATGGASFTSDASGLGPGNSTAWNSATYFGSSNYFWTNRGTGSGTLWPSTGSTNHCDDWTDGTTNFSAVRGYSNTATTATRWSTTTSTCSTAQKVVCIVSDVADTSSLDLIPVAVNWSDFNYESISQTITGVSGTILLGVTASSVVGSPTFYFSKNGNDNWIAFDSALSTDIGMSEGETLRFKIEGARSDSALLTIVNKSNGNAVLDTVTGTVRGAQYFVLSATAVTGDLGGLSGADSWCYTHLTAQNFKGKANATISRGTVKAFLCDSTRCQNPEASTDYYFATAGSLTLGGRKMTIDVSGLGPGDSKLWAAADYFGSSEYYWTARATGTATKWASLATDRCDNWTDSTSSFLGVRGWSNITSGGRWLNASYTCSTSARLICMVSDKVDILTDPTPVAVNWSDFNYASSSQTITGVSGTILLGVTASSVVGSPTFYFSKNGNDNWIAFDSALSTDIGMSEGETLRFKIEGTRSDSALLTIVNKSNGNAVLDTVTGTVRGRHLFVVSQATATGAFGSLLAANSWCISELTSTSWNGKSSVTIDATTTRAFLCDATVCNDLALGQEYNFAVAGNISLGGRVFIADAFGIGPNNSKLWTHSQNFGSTINYWTGRGTGVATAWSASTTGNHCNSWTNGTVGFNGTNGTSNSTTATRWNNTNSTCSSTRAVICLVDD